MPHNQRSVVEFAYLLLRASRLGSDAKSSALQRCRTVRELVGSVARHVTDGARQMPAALLENPRGLLHAGSDGRLRRLACRSRSSFDCTTSVCVQPRSLHE